MSIRIEHRIGITAPAPVIWEVLADLQRWPEWNPMYPQVEGALKIGGALGLTERTAESERRVNASVVDWVPESQILWRSALMGGWVKRLRYLEIEVLAATGCIFSNGEIWEGRYAGYAMKGGRGAYRRAFEGLGEALKQRSEAAWAALSPDEQARIERTAGPPPEPEAISKTAVPPKLGPGYFRR